MTTVRRPRPAPVARTTNVQPEADDLRRMAVLLETADVLETRARRTADPVRRAELLRRAAQRRRDAARIRQNLAARDTAFVPRRRGN